MLKHRMTPHIGQGISRTTDSAQSSEAVSKIITKLTVSSSGIVIRSGVDTMRVLTKGACAKLLHVHTHLQLLAELNTFF